MQFTVMNGQIICATKCPVPELYIQGLGELRPLPDISALDVCKIFHLIYAASSPKGEVMDFKSFAEKHNLEKHFSDFQDKEDAPQQN
jgi:hypothetical protein